MLKSIKNNGFIGLTALILALLFGSFSVYQYTQKNKIGYVTIGKIVDEFLMTKEKKQQVESLHFRRKGLMDSLEFQLTQLQRRIESGENNLLKEYQFNKEFYLEKTKAFDEDNELLEQEIQKQLFAQINQYIEEYGKENKLDLILGANGNGSIMHCNPKLDITKDVILYINKRYAGKK